MLINKMLSFPFRFFFLLLFVLPQSSFSRLLGESGDPFPFCYFPPENDYKFWYVGPLLSPAAVTPEPAHPAISIVPTATSTYGIYDASGHVVDIPRIRTLSSYLYLEVGFNEYVGAEVIVTPEINWCEGKRAVYFQDTYCRMGLQISRDKPNSWIPDFRILLQGILPTGHYQKLDPEKHLADSTGVGSFTPGFLLAFQKVFKFGQDREFRLNIAPGYNFPSPVAVSGFNAYGGDVDTRGKVFPGAFFSGFFCGEYPLSRTWLLALEGNYISGRGGRFTRYAGPEIDVPSYSQLSLLPEIEHSFSDNTGAILAYWFTTSGKNSFAFRALSFSFFYVF